MDPRRKKLLILSAALLIAVIAFLLFKTVKQQLNTSTIKAYASQTLAKNILFPDQSDGRTVRFFTGTAVAELDIDKLTSRSLTKELALPRVTDVRWAKDRVIIQSEKPGPDDEVFKPEYDRLLGTDQFAWWIMDISGSKIRLLNNGGSERIQDVVWKDDSNVFVVIRNSSSGKLSVVVQDMSGKRTKTNVAEADDLSLVGNTSSGLIVKRGTELFIVNNDGKEKKLPFKTSRKPVFDDGLLITEELTDTPETVNKELNAPKGKLVVYDAVKDKVVGDSIENTGNFSGNGAGLLVLPFLQQDIEQTKEALRLAAFTREGKTINLEIDEEQVLHAGSLKSIVKFEAKDGGIDILLANTSGELVKISSNGSIQDKKTPYPLLAFKTKKVNLGGKLGEYDGVTNTLIVELNPLSNLEKQKTAVLNGIKAAGLDPNLIKKRWLVIEPHEDEPTTTSPTKPDNYTGDGYLSEPI